MIVSSGGVLEERISYVIPRGILRNLIIRLVIPPQCRLQANRPVWSVDTHTIVSVIVTSHDGIGQGDATAFNRDTVANKIARRRDIPNDCGMQHIKLRFTPDNAHPSSTLGLVCGQNSVGERACAIKHI